MAFELEAGEAVGPGVRRIVDEQLADALGELRGGDARKVDEAVHAARKRIKRVRAVARLVRPELGEEVFAKENASLRDAGGTLSEARDAAVLVETLDRLKGEVDPAAFRASRKKLMARRRSVRERVLRQGEGLEAVARDVKASRERVGAWQIERDGWGAVKRGLKRIYGNGREAYKLAEVGAAAEVFHEWRKQVKNLWHQLEVLEAVWPAVMKKVADECHELADRLGKDHDLAVLREVLEKETGMGDVSPPIVKAIEAARGTLQREARGLGARVFAEKPKAFLRRIGAYWRAWRDEEAVEAKEEGGVEIQKVEADEGRGEETTTHAGNDGAQQAAASATAGANGAG